MKKITCLNANTLKIIAAIAMVFDHIGVLFFPQSMIFRIIGRISFPIFAFMISEGAKYTRNKLKYFLTVFSLATLCQIVYYFFDGGSLYMCILVTFSISILLIYLLNFAKRVIFDKDAKWYLKIASVLPFITAIVAVYFITSQDFISKTKIYIDYGFAGILTPVLASLFDFKGTKAPEYIKKIDTIPTRVICLAIGLITLAAVSDVLGVQYYALLAIPLLLMYSGERGRLKMKYFFYIFYPVHLAVLTGIYMLTLMTK